ncbi:MAG: putative protein phosphatase 2C-type [Deltaproteobacteria bacterium ADurb.Bin207]|jgi:protein phosphatase|nr:MAG: putative protein phosphatase 2C-type [Deltaproteobacteria bacterium ADurb.Bin207]
MVMPVNQPQRVSLAIASLSDPGLDPEKQVNEDACEARQLPIGTLLVVCDGMGGHVAGKEASEAALRTIFDQMQAASPDAHPGLALKNAIAHAGKVVFDLGGPSAMLRPGSTVVAVLSHPAGSEIAHVGDSRAYLIRDSQIHPLTRDHSMVQQMVDAGLLTEEEAKHHPDANKITRALGMSAIVDVEIRPSPLAHQQGDIFLLATDGLCDLVEPHEMLSMTMQARQVGSLDQACQQMIALANSRGGHDNTTVLLGEILSCPACSESRSRTLVTDDPIAVTGSAAVAAVPGAMLPTVVDGNDLGVSMPTWVDNGTAQDGRASEAELLQRRKLTWFVVGMALMVFGIAAVVISVWWAWQATASEEDEVGMREKASFTVVMARSMTERCRECAGTGPDASGMIAQRRMRSWISDGCPSTDGNGYFT